MSSGEQSTASRKSLLIKLGVLAVAGGVVGLLLLRGVDLRGLLDATVEFVRQLGPWTFFVAMAILPSFGVPLSTFTLTAGPVFVPIMGWPGVLFAAWTAMAANIAITYVGARWLARPWIEKLVIRLGYDWPKVRAENHWDFTILARVTPGPPFVLQSVILGLAQINFRIYMIGSVLISIVYGTVFIVFGEALIAGKGKMIVFGISAMAALSVGAQMLQRHLSRKKKLKAQVS